MPLVGTWIEIAILLSRLRRMPVVPLVGTWIEIDSVQYPSQTQQVVPLVGTWIEIFAAHPELQMCSRAPRGHVD